MREPVTTEQRKYKQEVLQKQSVSQAKQFQNQGLLPRNLFHPELLKAIPTTTTDILGTEYIHLKAVLDEYSIVGNQGIVLANLQSLQTRYDTNEESDIQKGLYR